MSTQQQTFWSQQQKKRRNDAEYKKTPKRKRKQIEVIHSSRFEIFKQEKTDKKRTHESCIAVTEDTDGSVQPPATKKCNHCGLTDHLRRTNARCPFNNSNTRAPPPLVQGVQHETTGTSTAFTDASNTCGSRWLA